MLASSELTEEQKVCFTCTTPVNMCGAKGVHCAFNKATQNRRHVRYRSTFHQESCGVEEKPLWEISDKMTEFCASVSKLDI